MKHARSLFLKIGICLSLGAFTVRALPLDEIPIVHEDYLQLLLEARSDLWSSPYAYKKFPVKLLNNSLRIPVYKSESVIASVQVFSEALSLGRAQFNLKDKDIFVGTVLRNEGVRLGVRKTMPGGGQFSLFGSLATASDKAWTSNSKYAEKTFLYISPFENQGAWLMALNMSDNRGVFNGKPFPYIGRIYEYNADILFIYGFPLLDIRWDRTQAVKKSFRINPFGMMFNLTKTLNNAFEFEGKAGVSFRSYLYASRTDLDTRLFYREMYAEIAMKKYVTPETGFLFAIGGAAERSLYEAKNLYDRFSNTHKIQGDFYLNLSVEFRL